MPRSPRFPAPDRPDPEARLLAAVAERDGPLARRLGERFVHRRGVVALEGLLLRKLEPIQGAEACGWLVALLGVDPPVRPAAVDGAEAPLLAVAAAEPRAKDVIAEAPVADPWAPVASGLEGIGGFSAADSPAATPDSVGAESGAALIASWLKDLGREQAELSQLAEAWKPAAEQLADAGPSVAAPPSAAVMDEIPSEVSGAPQPLAPEPQPAVPEVVEPRLGEPKLAAIQASDMVVFGGAGSPASAPVTSAPLSLAEGSFDNPFETGSLAAHHPEEIAQTAPLAPPLTPSLPAQQSDPVPLLRRLQAVATPDAQGPRTGQLAPVPASLARLRSWLHEDQLPEAS